MRLQRRIVYRLGCSGPDGAEGDARAMTSTATTTESPAPIVSVEDLGPCLKRLRIEAPAEAVDRELEAALEALASEAQLPGFRKGKVPRRLLERRFGQFSRDEAKQRIISQAYRKALEEHELRVVGDPELSDEIAALEVEPGKPLTFSVDVEVAPDVALPDLSDVTVVRPLVEITPEMVERELDRLRADHGSLEDRDVAERGDYATGRGVMRVEGEEEPVLDIPGAVIRIPTEDEGEEGMILGVKVEDFAAQVGSPQPGQTVTVKTVGPEHHEDERVRGKALTIEFTVEKVYRVHPATAEETAQALGLGDADQLRSIITQRLEQRVLLEQQAAMRAQLADALLERVEMELPQRLTAAQAARNLERRRLELLQQGASDEEIERALAELRAASDEAAARELKLFFLLDAAARELDIEVTEQEVAGAVAQIAASRGLRPADVRAELARTGRLHGVAQQIREHKTLDALLAQANVEEMSAEEFNQRRSEQAEDAGKTETTKKKKTASRGARKKSSRKKP